MRPLSDRLAALGGYSLERGLSATAARLDMLVRLLRTFIARYRDGDDALRAALAAGDWPAVGRAAHSLRGACATVGATHAAELAQALENQLAPEAEPPESSAVADAVLRLDEELRRLCSAIAVELSG